MNGPAPPRIGIVLPYRERLTLAHSGAIALCIRDFNAYSRHRASTTLLGGLESDVPDIPYQKLDGWQRWYLPNRIGYALGVAREAERAHFDLIEIQNRPSMVRWLRRALPDTALVLHLHNDPQDMAGAKSASQRRQLLKQLSAIYCVSHYIRGRFLEGLEDLDPQLQARVVTLHNGMDIPNLPQPRPKEPMVFFAGRIIEAKGVLPLVQGFALCAARIPQWRLVFAGPDQIGLFQDKIPAMAAPLAALGDRCVHLGLLGHGDTMGEFARAEISAVPTLTPEPFARTAQEAMACGSALITSGSGGLRESAGDAGLIVTPPTPQALADAIMALALDEPRRRDLQQRGKARMAEMFDIRHQAALLDGVRDSILGLSSQPVRA